MIVLLILSFSAMTGCVETPAASPALVDEDALKSYGWSQTGTEEHRTREQKISDSASISINSTVVKYRNDRLEKDIQEQVSDFKSEYKIPVNIEVPPITSEIHTNRVTFPAGVKLPNDIITRIMESNANELSSENNIEDFRTTGTRQVTLQDGLTVPVYIYSGTRGSGSDGLSVIGIVAAYENQGSNTVITGIIPNGSMSVSLGPVNGTLFTIDGERELEEVLRLISTIQ
jgi:PIN domain nuclease of toxin-antitoxin system